MSKKKTVKTERPGFKDLVTLAANGWTPGQVNELLDRFDSLGDLNAPDEPDEVDDEDIDIDAEDQDEPDEDEDNNVSDEDEEDEDGNEDENSSDDAKTKKKDTNKYNSLEIENTRLKKQIQKLQQKNRSKDISGGENEKPIEKSLIDLFQSKFD